MIALAVCQAFVLPGFVPEREFDPVPESKFVVDDSQVVFYHMLSGADDVGYFAVFESLSNEFDDLLLAWAGLAGSVKAAARRGRAGNCRMHSELLI